MKFKISWVIMVLATYLPFETFLLKYIPMPDTVYSYVRIMGIEVTIYLLLVIMVFNNMAHGKFLKRTILDIPILVFLGYALFTMFANNAPVLESLIDIRSLFKYAVLYFVVANIDFEPKLIRYFFGIFIVIALIQSLIVVEQHIYGISDFWYPKASNLEIGGKTSATFRLLSTAWNGGREQGSGIGTFGDTVPLGNFMVISIVVIAALFIGYIRINAYKMVFIGVVMLFALFSLFCTYSRGSVLVGVMGIPLVYFFTKNMHKLYPVVLGCALVVCGYVTYNAIVPDPPQAYFNPKRVYTDPVSNVLEAFSSSYIDHDLDYSRGYVISTLIPGFIKTIPLIGFGPCMENSLNQMCDAVLGEGNFHAENVMVIADVYWFALLSCYGIIGVALFCGILGTIFYGGFVVFKKSEQPEYKVIGLIMFVLIIVNMPYMFIIRTLLFRPFAFYFWFFAGLVASEYRRIKAKELMLKQQAKIQSVTLNKEIAEV